MCQPGTADLRDAVKRAEFAVQMPHQRAVRNAFARDAADQFGRGIAAARLVDIHAQPLSQRQELAAGGTSSSKSPKSFSACSKSWAA